jgi:hypothetical protein
MVRTLGILTLLSLLGGCSAESEEEAQQKCRDLVGDWCSKIYSCAVDSGDITESEKAGYVSDCKKTGEASIECSKAVSTSDNYDSCMDTVHSISCTSIGSDGKIPSQCSGVIEIPK